MAADDIIRASRPQKILCVDDAIGIRSVLQLALARDGFVVETAGDGLDAWQRLSPNLTAVDLVITDDQMPNVTGLELVRRLRDAKFPGKVIFFSSAFGEKDAARLQDLGVDAVLQKGSSLARLLSMVHCVLGPRRPDLEPGQVSAFHPPVAVNRS